MLLLRRPLLVPYFAVTSAAALGPGCITRAPAVPESCEAAPRTLEPLVVDWSAPDLERYQALAKDGVVVVHADGCSLRPLPACHAVGRYAYVGVAPSADTVVLEDDLRAFAPGAAVRIDALGRRATMRLERTFIGQWVATGPSTSTAQLTGDCALATHVVRRVWVGAYDFASGQRSLSMRGAASACAAGAADAKAPPDGCDAWVKIDLAPVVATPAAGDACDASMQGCADASRALFCAGGKVASVPCRGEGGCRLGSDGARCDDTVALAGEPCVPGASETYACSVDRADALVCSGGTFGLWRHCRGVKRCGLTNGAVDCDSTAGQVGDPCDAASGGGVACSTDHASLLRCERGTLVPAGACRGPKGCTLDGKTFRVLCDN